MVTQAFTLQDLATVEGHFKNVVEDKYLVCIGDKMPTLAERDTLIQTLQGELDNILQLMYFELPFKPTVVIQFGKNSIDIEIEWRLKQELFTHG